MKRKLALLTAVLLLVTLFAGCGGGGQTTTPTAAPATQAPATASPATPSGGNATPAPTAPPEDTGPYNYAAGKYALDSRGVPAEKYTYELPLTTSDEVFTYWTGAMVPDQIDPDHYEEMPYPSYLLELTGVHIEYHVIASASRKENFAALLASDDLLDLMISYSSYYPSTMFNSIEDGYSINLYDYKEYMPNYYYEIWNHEEDVNVRSKLMLNDHTIATFQGLNDEAMNSYGLCARGDLMDKIGIKVDDVATMDDLHDLAVALQSQAGVEFPLVLYNILDPHRYMNAFDTIPSTNPTAVAVIAPLFVKDGKVECANTTDGDKNYMTTISKWFSEGIIIPYWNTWTSNLAFVSDFTDNKVAITSMIPSEADGYVDKEKNPGSYFTGLHEPVLYKGQVFHLGSAATWVTGFATNAITTKCDNIPLLVTYVDWFYSPEGVELANWGREGNTDGCVFYYNEKGERQLSDFILNNTAGPAWAILQFAYCDIYDPGILHRRRSYAYPGGEKLLAWYDTWANPDFYQYDGSMVYPDSVNMDDEDRNYLKTVGTDLNTFVTENYTQFVDGSRPMSDWDNYIASVESLVGYKEVHEIWQKYYDEFKKEHGL